MDPGAIVEIGFAQGPYKLNDGSGKTNYPGTIDRSFTVLPFASQYASDFCWAFMKVHTGKTLFGMFPIQNGLKKGETTAFQLRKNTPL
jgi:hypothetical protein